MYLMIREVSTLRLRQSALEDAHKAEKSLEQAQALVLKHEQTIFVRQGSIIYFSFIEAGVVS